MFTETVGALDPILESFEEEVGRIALGEKGDTDEAFARLDANLEEEIRKAKELEELRHDFVLDWRSLAARRASEAARAATPRATRETSSGSAALRSAASCRRVESESHYGRRPLRSCSWDASEGRKDVEEDYRGSFDVQEALSDERMHFFAMGHPLVESILDNVGDPWWRPSALSSPPSGRARAGAAGGLSARAPRHSRLGLPYHPLGHGCRRRAAHCRD